MKRFYVHLFLFIFPVLLFAQEVQTRQARAFAAKLLAETRVPGLSIAVSVGDSIVWLEGFGLADVSQKIPVTRSTRFRIGSVTKLLTAAAAARLYEQGRLDLDAPVQQYVPSFPDKGKPITTRQLLGHTSGIRHYSRSEFFNRHRYESVSEALTIFQNDSLLFAPGTRYGYSSYGYVLASAVIEAASGKNFLSFLKEEVIEPLSLRSIGPDYNDTLDTSQAKPYSLDSLNSWIIGPFNDNSNRWAAGGFLSTSEDLVRFGSSLQKDGFLNTDTRKLLFTSQKTSEGKVTGVGLGWRVGKDSLGHQYFHHGGESIGSRAYLLIYPSSNVIVALLANLTFARFGEKEALELAKIFMK
jgi:CubicO group peptidase (beta-lactamase class C family)